MNLVIVESPTKSKTISKFLGKNYKVESSYGHVRDLPKSRLGVDIEHNYQPKYVIPTKAKPRVSLLKKAAKGVETIILASDGDREGEAIAWHLIEALKPTKKQKTERIVFHEITKGAIEEALKHPRALDMNLIDSQQARRILDRLVGYKLSPFLWKKVAKGLSAGRVQSVAVRIIVDRAREIEKFKPDEYWSVEASLKKKDDAKEKSFTASLTKKDNKSLDKLEIKTDQAAKDILKELKDAEYKIEEIESREVKRNPAAPFTTSTLQQAAAGRLGWSAKRTMMVAQQLYEGINRGKKGTEGLITYMRTDSLNLSEQALKAANSFISQEFGANYALPSPRYFKNKSKSAQEAHEAIRPTQVELQPDDIKEHLDSSQYKLYDLIWRRFVACQMQIALLNQTGIDIKANSYTFHASGSSIKFDGWLKVYPTKFTESLLPQLSKDEILDLLEIKPEQHFTQPPPKYSEASLIKILEKYGIGRPSTYAPIISTIQNRGYVIKNQQKRFDPTDTGLLVTDMLIEHFEQIVDVKFTARMEDELDEIADGKTGWEQSIREFYEPFAKKLEEKYESVKSKKVDEETDKICPDCGKPIVIKRGRFGKFYACTGFPECRHTEALLKKTGVKCPKCQKGDIAERRSKKGRTFYSCSRYPACEFSLWKKPSGEACPKCKSLMVYGKNESQECSNKECKYKAESEE